MPAYFPQLHPNPISALRRRFVRLYSLCGEAFNLFARLPRSQIYVRPLCRLRAIRGRPFSGERARNEALCRFHRPRSSVACGPLVFAGKSGPDRFCNQPADPIPNAARLQFQARNIPAGNCPTRHGQKPCARRNRLRFLCAFALLVMRRSAPAPKVPAIASNAAATGGTVLSYTGSGRKTKPDTPNSARAASRTVCPTQSAA